MASKNVFQQLKESSQNIKKSLDCILKTAPKNQLFKLLQNEADDPFLNAVLDKNGISTDLHDPDIIFAVKFKDLYQKGELKIFNNLMDGHDVGDGINIETEESNTQINENKIQTINEQTCKKEDKKKDAEVPSDDETSLISQIIYTIPPTNGENLNKRERNFERLDVENPPAVPHIHDPELLRKIFTHQSIMNYMNIPEQEKVQAHNERLEFLGDAFLQFISSMILYERFPKFTEGQLSMLRSEIVSNKTLLNWSKMYGFDKQLRKNFNETSILTGNNKIYADVFEAYLGGIAEQFMTESKDGLTNTTDFMKGWFISKEWIERLAEDQIRSFDPNIVIKMLYSKSAKQDIRLLVGTLNVVEYVRADVGGKTSGKTFLSGVKISNKIYGYGLGTSNKEADARAAIDAMKNPLLKGVCTEELWKKFEDNLGLNDQGGLNFDDFSMPANVTQIEKLRREIAIKHRTGSIHLLKSSNNPISLFIDDQDRKSITKSFKPDHSISAAFEDLKDENKDTDQNGKDDENENANKTEIESQSGNENEEGDKYEDHRNENKSGRHRADRKMERMNKNGIHDSGGDTDDAYRKRSSDKEKRNGQKVEVDSNDEHVVKYYHKQYTLGRGGVFNDEESKRIKVRCLKSKHGIYRNISYTTSDGVTMMCHEVLVKVDELDMDAKNKINSVFSRRGGTPDYRLYRTDSDMYLCELWFSSEQIVSYGLDKNKQFASQKAAMLAQKREIKYNYED